MNEFRTYHPLVNFTYFVFIIIFSCVYTHPFCLAVSLTCALVYYVMQKGVRAALKSFLYMLPAMLFAALINPAFNHEGATIVTYFPDGNPLTLESVIYGIAAAAMLFCVIFWFFCYGEVMTSDKFIYLFGRIIPSLSLIFSMTLRLVPRFVSQLKSVSDARRCCGCANSDGGIIKRCKHGLTVLFAAMSWALENSVETADSMKARGYGLYGRSAFSVFTFDKRDARALACVLLLGLYVLAGGLAGQMYFRYFPSVKSVKLSALSFSVFAAYAVFAALPIIIEIKEAVRWNVLKSKI